MSVPNGNCRYSPKSGRIVNQKYISIRNYDIMSKLVLSYHFSNVMRVDFILWLLSHPREDLVKAGMAIDLF